MTARKYQKRRNRHELSVELILAGGVSLAIIIGSIVGAIAAYAI